eukprot:115916_1
MHDAVDLLQRQIEKAITAGDLSGLPSADALEVVVSTFQTVLEQITIEHESDQETMSATSDAASECSTSMTRVNGSLGNVSVRRTEHKTCRGGEDDALHSENVACTLMRTRVLAAHTAAEETIGSCPRSSWDASTEDAGAAAMLSCFKQVKAWLEGHYSALNSSKHECDSKAAEAVAKASECDNAQKTFESMFCQYAMAQESLCAEQSLCRALRVSYNQTMIRESSRKILWTAATHGICLVQVVRTAKERNITQTDLDGCLHSPANTTNLTISYPAEMAHVSTIATKCAEVGDLKRPGDAEWESVEYAGLSHLDDVMPCATPPATTTAAPSPALASMPVARLSGVLYNGQPASVSSMPVGASVGSIAVKGSAGAFVPVASTGYFTMPRGSFFELSNVIGRGTWTMYFLFNIGTAGRFTFAGADPGGYGELDSEVGFGSANNNFVQSGVRVGEMFFSTHYSQGVNNGVRSDGKLLNDDKWHWVEFEASMDTPRYTMVFEDGSSFEETNVNAGFGRNHIPFRVFCGQGCDQHTMKVSEAIVYNKVLGAEEKDENRRYLSALLDILST